MRLTPETELQLIEEAVRRHPEGASLEQLGRALPSLRTRTLRNRLSLMVAKQRLTMTGTRRWARYHVKDAPAPEIAAVPAEVPADFQIPVSAAGAQIQHYVRRPPEARTPAGYDRSFLEAYRPNETAYLSASERAHLHKIGTPQMGDQPAGTYAKQILNRLLIDLSWNSSRLEGNTYSLLDTRRLIDLGLQAEGKDQIDAQMILNHKDAIEFLVSEATEIGFNRYTILNLHGILANNLLPDPDAPGRLRQIGVGITGSVFHPLEVPQLIEECFEQVLASAAAIKDAFEQAFFIMVQLPYLQPFEDVNKRVSRLAANIPLIKGNLSPLSFADVPKQAYTEGMLGVYELRQVDLLKDIFIWGYERSASRYAQMRQSLGEPDPFRLRHREALRALIAEIVRRPMNNKEAAAYIASWTAGNIEASERDKFQETAESELLALHEGNFARYQIRPSEFDAWRKVGKAS